MRALCTLVIAATSLAGPLFAQSPTGPVVELAGNFGFVEGPASFGAEFYFTDIPASTIHRVAADGAVTVFTDQSNHANGLWAMDPQTLLACEMDGAVVSYDLSTGDRTVLTDSHDGNRYNACNDLVVDAEGGIYFTDPQFRAPEPLPQGVRAVYFRPSEGGPVQRLTGDLPNPNGIALSPDGSRLYVAPSGASTMLVTEVQQPGSIGELRTFCELKQPEGKTGEGSDGLTVDENGNVYFTTALGVQIVDPAGQWLRTIELPQQPANVTFGGIDGRTLIATARTAVYTVRMDIAGLRKP